MIEAERAKGFEERIIKLACAVWDSGALRIVRVGLRAHIPKLYEEGGLLRTSI